MTYRYTDRRLKAAPLNCVESVASGMSSNRLRLNPSKTELIWLGTSRSLQHCTGLTMSVCGADVRSSAFAISVSWLTETWRFWTTSTTWLASASTSSASYASSDVHWRRKLHTRLSGPSSTPESTTATDSSPPVRITWFPPHGAQQQQWQQSQE